MTSLRHVAKLWSCFPSWLVLLSSLSPCVVLLALLPPFWWRWSFLVCTFIWLVLPSSSSLEWGCFQHFSLWNSISRLCLFSVMMMMNNFNHHRNEGGRQKPHHPKGGWRRQHHPGGDNRATPQQDGTAVPFQMFFLFFLFHTVGRANDTNERRRRRRRKATPPNE